MLHYPVFCQSATYIAIEALQHHLHDLYPSDSGSDRPAPRAVSQDLATVAAAGHPMPGASTDPMPVASSNGNDRLGAAAFTADNAAAAYVGGWRWCAVDLGWDGGIRSVSEMLDAYLHRDDRDDDKFVEYGDLLGSSAMFKRLGYLLERTDPPASGLVDACRARRSSGINDLDPSVNAGGPILPPGGSAATSTSTRSARHKSAEPARPAC